MAALIVIFVVVEGSLVITYAQNTQQSESYLENSGNNNLDNVIISEVKNQLDMMEINAKEYNLQWNINISAEVINVMNWFTKLDANTTLGSLVSEYGVQSFSISLQHNYSSNLTISNFLVTWVGNNYVNMITWSINLNNKTSATQYQTDYPAVYSANATPSLLGNSNESTGATNHVSSNWAGFEFYTGNTITASSANFNVATIAMPPSSQVDPSVNQVAAMWIGLSNGAGGVGGLAQTGYATDATPSSNSFNYSLWWEVYDPNSQVGTPMEKYSASATASPGNILDATVQRGNGSWNFEIYNYNTSQTFTASHSMWWSIFNEQFNAYYNQYIIEAYSSGSTIQQIAEFYPAVNFEAGTLYSNGVTQFTTNLFNSSSYNTYTMEQSSSGANIDSYYVLAPGTYDTSLWGYSQDTWLNSYYG